LDCSDLDDDLSDADSYQPYQPREKTGVPLEPPFLLSDHDFLNAQKEFYRLKKLKQTKLIKGNVKMQMVLMAELLGH